MNAAGRPKKLIWLCTGGLVACALLAAAAFHWVRFLQDGPPPGMLKDLRAGLAARGVTDPDKRLLRYLEERYGPMSDPAHRQEAFLDFFNAEHIRALQLLVKHSPEAHRQDNIDAMARWVECYRASLNPEERAALRAQFQTQEGQALLKQATALYNSQDVRYRGSTAPVISELLRTLHQIEHSQ